MEEEFKGASKTVINAVVADRGADLMRNKNGLLIEAQTLSQQVNNKVNTAEQNYKLNLQQENLQREEILQDYNMDLDTFDRKRAEKQSQLAAEASRQSVIDGREWDLKMRAMDF